VDVFVDLEAIKLANKPARDIGSEILEGLREIKRGEIGCVVIYPPSAEPVPPTSMPGSVVVQPRRASGISPAA